jgi:SlyX protein
MSAEKKMEVEARLAELEIKLSFNEDLVETLNRTVARQQEQINMLQDEMRAFYRQIQQLTSGDNVDPREEIPPHY